MSVLVTVLLGCGPRATTPAVPRSARATHANDARYAEWLARTHWDEDKQIPAPTRNATLPWRVGQWALYKHVERGEVAFDRITVIAEDRCGVWIQWVRELAAKRVTWTVCYRLDPRDSSQRLVKSPQIAIRQNENQSVTIFDIGAGQWRGLHELESEVRNIDLFARATIPEAGALDATVPAGHFPRAAYEGRRDSEIWSHPEVPIGGLVKRRMRSGEVEDELLLYGNSTPDIADLIEIGALRASASPSRIPASPSPPFSRMFMLLGVGDAYVTDYVAAPSASGYVFAVGNGRELTRDLELLIEFAFVSSGTQEVVETGGLAALALRWHLFRPARSLEAGSFAPRALYLQAGLGFAWLDRSTPNDADTVAYGATGGGALGWTPVHARDWWLGLELSDRIALYNAGEGMRQNISLAFTVQLYLPERN